MSGRTNFADRVKKCVPFMLAAAVLLCLTVYIARAGIAYMCSEAPEVDLGGFMVAEMAEPTAGVVTACLSAQLPYAELVMRVRPTEGLFCARDKYLQRVEVLEVFSGSGPEAGSEVYLTSPSWKLLRGRERGDLAEISFTNAMRSGSEYLVFAGADAVGSSGGLPVYSLYYKDGYTTLSAMFCYDEVENVIAPVDGLDTYVPYSEVSGNEFFAADERALEHMLGLKREMLSLYPRTEI